MWSTVSSTNRNNLFLLAALCVYGVFSSPTPDTITWAEIVIGFCLFCAAGIRSFATIFSGFALWHGDRDKRILTACFLAMFLLPVITGIINRHSMNDILRDIIPLGFFFLPLFLHDMMRRDPVVSERVLRFGLCWIGVFFALRFWPASGLTATRFGLDRGNDEMLYLTSSPAVMTAGLYLFFVATEITPRRLVVRVLALLAAAICLMTIVATLQRGAIVLALLVMFFVTLSRLPRSPFLLLFCAGATLAFIFIFGQTFVDVIAMVWRKTLEVGDNARLAELKTVIHALGDNPLHWMFGMGWGARVLTAASGYAEVRYTHMLASYTLLKCGVLGLGALVVYGFWLLHNLVRRFTVNPMLVMAITPSLVLGFLVYPSFKMLCFGIMLALLAHPLSRNKTP